MNHFQKFIKFSGINQRSWLNPLLWALIPATLIIWLQPIKFNPLLFELHSSSEKTVWFADLQHDGIKEKLIVANDDAVGNANIVYYNDEGKYINQFNYNHPVAKQRAKYKPYCADINKDRVKEVFTFTQNKDSLFLEAFDYHQQDGIVRNRFITTIGGYNSHLDYQVNWLGHCDANKDTIPELYFSIAGGFALYPRRIFRYDYANDSLIASVNTGAGHLSGLIIENQDSILISVGSIAHGNTRADYPFQYHDSTTWLFCFDKDLKLKFPPKSYGINPSGIDYPMYKNGFIYYLFGSNNAQQENKLFKMNWQGEVVDSLQFDFYVSKRFFEINYKNKRYDCIYNETTREYLYVDFKNFSARKFKPTRTVKPHFFLQEIDLNNDGAAENIFINKLNFHLIICNHKLKIQEELPFNTYPRFITSNYFEDYGYGELIMNSQTESVTYRYHNNAIQYLKYPFWFFIYLMSLLFVAFILYFQNIRFQKLNKMQQQLANLQLKNVRNQLDPHFTYNVLNTIGSAIYKEDKNAAYDLFQRFTRIIRLSLMSSEKVLLTLKEEIQFTQDYLEFQKLRFKDRFEYKLEVAPEFKQKYILFPKMLMQAYAENAVKHAFYNRDDIGLISIKISSVKKRAQIIIEDNGIGIKHSKKIKATSGTQKGEKLLEDQINQINKLYKTDYSVEIIDKKDHNNKSTGTKVIISFSK